MITVFPAPTEPSLRPARGGPWPAFAGLVVLCLLLTGCASEPEWRERIRTEQLPPEAQAAPQIITPDGSLAPQEDDAAGGPGCTIQRFAENPAAEVGVLNDAEAESAFACIEPQIAASFENSRHALARALWDWTRTPDAPFAFPDAPDRMAAIYANPRALGLEQPPPTQRDRGFPIGAALSAIGFIVDENGVVSPGETLLVEKMPRGFNPANGNWRYTILDAKGARVSVAPGPNAPEDAPCADCGVEEADLFYLSFLNRGLTPIIETAEPAPE